MKKAAIFISILLLFVFCGLSHAYSENNHKKYRVIVDETVTQEILPSWLAYGGTRLRWHNDTFFEKFPEEKEYRYTFQEELEAREALIQVYSELAEKGRAFHDKYLDELVKVYKNNYLKEYILFYFRNLEPGLDQGILKMDDFIAWSKENIPGHKIKTLVEIVEN